MTKKDKRELARRDRQVESYMKWHKRDLAIVLTDTRYALDQVIRAYNKKNIFTRIKVKP